MLIYKQYDQAALDRQYNNRVQVPDFATHLERWESLSRQTEKEYAVIKDLVYGKLPREQLDIYPSLQTSSKTLIFIHGGYWQKFDKSIFHFVAKAFRSYGITCVLINYPLAPLVTMDQVLLSCRRAVRWIYKNITAYHGDPDQLYIAGHSAGAQLGAMLLATDQITRDHPNQHNEFDLTPAMIKGACLISGIFNLVPIMLTDLNQALHMDEPIALRNSPVQYLPSARCPVTMAVGSNETDEFLDQSHELFNCWKEYIPAEMVELQGLNHFSILETMLDPGSGLHQLMRRMMKI